MKAFIEASRRLRADYQPGLWIGAIRPAFGAGEVEQDGRIERYDTAILKPQPHELGGFVLLQGSRQQIDTLVQEQLIVELYSK